MKTLWSERSDCQPRFAQCKRGLLPHSGCLSPGQRSGWASALLRARGRGWTLGVQPEPPRSHPDFTAGWLPRGMFLFASRALLIFLTPAWPSLGREPLPAVARSSHTSGEVPGGPGVLAQEGPWGLVVQGASLWWSGLDGFPSLILSL